LKKVYHTEPRREVIRFLRDHKGVPMTAEEIFAGLPEDTAGKSTVYRLLKQLEAEGYLIRSVREETRQAQYLLRERSDCDRHMHLQCLECGRLIHIEGEAAEHVRGEIMDHYGIQLDQSKSLLYGRCSDCRDGNMHGGKQK